jgi:myosin heavy subunit
VFDSPLCYEQLRYSGAFEAITIRKQGFPFRLAHRLFLNRFRCCVSTKNKPSMSGLTTNKQSASACSQLIVELGKIEPDLLECEVGTTLVLYKALQFGILERLRSEQVRRSDSCQLT